MKVYILYALSFHITYSFYKLNFTYQNQDTKAIISTTLFNIIQHLFNTKFRHFDLLAVAI